MGHCPRRFCTVSLKGHRLLFSIRLHFCHPRLPFLHSRLFFLFAIFFIYLCVSLDDIYFLWDISKPNIDNFINQANSQPTYNQVYGEIRLKYLNYISSYIQTYYSRTNPSIRPWLYGEKHIFKCTFKKTTEIFRHTLL